MEVTGKETCSDSSLLSNLVYNNQIYGYTYTCNNDHSVSDLSHYKLDT